MSKDFSEELMAQILGKSGTNEIDSGSHWLCANSALDVIVCRGCNKRQISVGVLVPQNALLRQVSGLRLIWEA